MAYGSEFRISNIARYPDSAIITVPLQRFITDGNTLGLWHMDEGAGTVINDSSGNGHIGTLNGAWYPWAPFNPRTVLAVLVQVSHTEPALVGIVYTTDTPDLTVSLSEDSGVTWANHVIAQEVTSPAAIAYSEASVVGSDGNILWVIVTKSGRKYITSEAYGFSWSLHEIPGMYGATDVDFVAGLSTVARPRRRLVAGIQSGGPDKVLDNEDWLVWPDLWSLNWPSGETYLLSIWQSYQNHNRLWGVFGSTVNAGGSITPVRLYYIDIDRARAFTWKLYGQYAFIMGSNRGLVTA